MSEPITTALRGLLCAKPKGDPCWDAMDAVDAVHAALEAENAALRAKVEELDNGCGSIHDGGSITDELREWAEQHKGWHLFDLQLEGIADRIDAEHDRACKRERGEGIKIAEEAAMEEMGQEYVKLPVDADGVPIHIGDVMDGTCPSGKHVNGTVSAIGDGVFWLSNVQFSLKPDYMHHYHAPTVEDVLRQFLGACEHASMLGYTDMPQDIFDTYTAKLRLAGDAS